MESLIHTLQSLDPLLVLFLLFAIAFIENLFPPAPSDVLIVLGGALVGFGRLEFVPTLLCATAGSVTGFMLMYKIGDWFGDHILERGKISFIKISTIHKVEEWFRKHGYWVIVVNRFLAGTRAVVSFFAGMSEMKFPVTVLLCAVSALAWNAALVSGGYMLGHNWQQIESYLDTYSRVVTVILVLVAIGLTARYLVSRYHARKKQAQGGGTQ